MLVSVCMNRKCEEGVDRTRCNRRNRRERRDRRKSM